MNLRFQNAIAKTSNLIPPIWMMRQAGRYHTHYQTLRKKYAFDQLCRLPELATEVTLGPIRDFDFDVAILFSDLLYPLDALGFQLHYPDGGPVLRRHFEPSAFWQAPARNEAEIAEKLNFQFEALAQIRRALPAEKSLIGFTGGLWTLFGYAVEGGHSGLMAKSKEALLSPLGRDLLTAISNVVTIQIERQLEAGAEVVMLFDTAAGELGPAFFAQHFEPSLLALAKRFPGRLGYYSKNTHLDFFSPAFFNAPWAGMGWDHRTSLSKILTVRNERKSGFLQGNFDPAYLSFSDAEFDAALRNYLSAIKQLPPECLAGWVCGLGHGVTPSSRERNVKQFVAKVREAF